MRDFRNYIHPNKELQQDSSPNKHTAQLCIDVIRSAVSDIKKDISQISAPMALDDWAHHPDAFYIALISLVGAWDDNNKADTKSIEKLLGMPYKNWLKKSQDISQLKNSPLHCRNRIWTIENRVQLLKQVGIYIFYNHIDIFKELCLQIFKESDPAFELPSEQRYAARVYGKNFTYSSIIRKKSLKDYL